MAPNKSVLAHVLSQEKVNILILGKAERRGQWMAIGILESVL